MSLISTEAKISANTSQLPFRLVYVLGLVLFAFLLLVVRLWQLQIIHGEENYLHTMQNVVDSQVLPSVRGKILDKNLEPIADNRPAFNLYGVASQIDDFAEERIGRLLRLSKEEKQIFHLRLEESRAKYPGHGVSQLLLEDQSRDRAALVKQERQALGMLEVRDEPFRFYPRGRALAHLVGYMNRITPAELIKREKDGYAPHDIVGRYGLEKAWERYLRGKSGLERYIVNAKGRRIKEGPDTEGLISLPRYIPPVPGHNMVLTIDLALQEMVERELRRQAAGAVAVVEVSTGKILALASTPSFDPNVMTGHLSKLQYGQMLSDPRKPFIDKTLRQFYPPGSTYKFIAALAALEKKLVSESESLTCTGGHELGKRLFRCTGRHGPVNIVTAIQRSCNVYFWKLAERVGIDSMAEVARNFGFGAATGLGINGDTPGRVPTREWYEEREVFRIGHALNAATGQGDVEVSVLQLAMAYAALASGKLYVPQVVDRVESAAGAVVVQYNPQLRHEIAASEENLDIIRTGMWKVINQPGGTGYRHARSEWIEYSGKTGTAQVRAMENRADDNELTNWHPDRDHAWFAGFAPSVNPEIAFVVFLEHGGFGGTFAGPIGKEIVEFYFANRKPKQSKGEENALELPEVGL